MRECPECLDCHIRMRPAMWKENFVPQGGHLSNVKYGAVCPNCFDRARWDDSAKRFRFVSYVDSIEDGQNVEFMDEMTAGGAGTMGYQLPMGIRRRKKALDKVVESSDVGHGGLLLFLRGLDESGSKLVCEHLDQGRYGQVARLAREAIARILIRGKIEELVRKKNGKFVLYAPNRGKKHQARVNAEFPSELAAKRAELSRFPPKDPKKLGALRKRIEKLSNGPKKSTTKSEVSEIAAAASKILLERRVITHLLVRDVAARLDGAPMIEGKGWDDYVDRLSNRIVKSDPGLKRIEKAAARAQNSAEKKIASSKRDRYLNRLEKQIDSIVSKLTPLGVNMLRRLLQQKYRMSEEKNNG